MLTAPWCEGHHVVDRLQLQPPGLDLGEVQDVVDAEQGVGGLADGDRKPALVSVSDVSSNSPLMPMTPFMGADLVAHGREEVGLGPGSTSAASRAWRMASRFFLRSVMSTEMPSTMVVSSIPTIGHLTVW